MAKLARRADEESAVDVTALLSYRLLVLSNTLGRWAAREYPRRFNLTLPEWRIISVLGARGPISPIEVSNLIAVDRAWISRTVPRLAERGLLQVQDDPGDRRRTLLLLTANGAHLHRTISQVSLERQRRLTQALGEKEAADFDRTLAKLQRKAEVMLEEQSTPNGRATD